MKRAANPVSSVVRTFEVLNLLKVRDEAGVTEIAAELGISKGTAHNHLATLEEHGFVVGGGGRYRLGLEFIIFGEYVRHHSALYQNGKEPVDDLAVETGEYAHLSTEQQGRGIKLYKARGGNAFGGSYQSSKFQHPDPLHHTATGKAILAHLPRAEVDEIIEYYGLPAITEHTITDRERLYDELDDIAERGFALNDEEEVYGIRAVGAPIRDPEDRAIGAVSVSGPTSRFGDDMFLDVLPEEVMRAGNIIEARINMAAQRGNMKHVMRAGGQHPTN